MEVVGLLRQSNVYLPFSSEAFTLLLLDSEVSIPLLTENWPPFLLKQWISSWKQSSSSPNISMTEKSTPWHLVTYKLRHSYITPSSALPACQILLALNRGRHQLAFPREGEQ